MNATVGSFRMWLRPPHGGQPTQAAEQAAIPDSNDLGLNQPKRVLSSTPIHIRRTDTTSADG
jgi:hypothetical protein